MADKTNNKIEDLLDEDNVDGLTRMVLVNAVYFKGEDLPYRVRSIRVRYFYVFMYIDSCPFLDNLFVKKCYEHFFPHFLDPNLKVFFLSFCKVLTNSM